MRSEFEAAVCHDGTEGRRGGGQEGRKEAWQQEGEAPCLHSQETQRDARGCSAHWLLRIQSRTLVHGVVVLT